jgi:hypothetical protein
MPTGILDEIPARLSFRKKKNLNCRDVIILIVHATFTYPGPT